MAKVVLKSFSEYLPVAVVFFGTIQEIVGSGLKQSISLKLSRFMKMGELFIRMHHLSFYVEASRCSTNIHTVYTQRTPKRQIRCWTTKYQLSLGNGECKLNSGSFYVYWAWKYTVLSSYKSVEVHTRLYHRISMALGNCAWRTCSVRYPCM